VRVYVHQDGKRSARPKREETQRLVDEEIDEVFMESGLADSGWEHGACAEVVFDFALEEQRHVVDGLDSVWLPRAPALLMNNT